MFRQRLKLSPKQHIGIHNTQINEIILALNPVHIE